MLSLSLLLAPHDSEKLENFRTAGKNSRLNICLSELNEVKVKDVLLHCRLSIAAMSVRVHISNGVERGA